jgi:hypothetical protein
MLRVTVVESSRSAVTLRVEGRITGSFVEELRRACDVHAFAENVQLSLELADVSFADGIAKMCGDLISRSRSLQLEYV